MEKGSHIRVPRISFDRRESPEVDSATIFYVHDKVPIPDGYERVYTVITAADINNAPDKIRFWTGKNGAIKCHEEEPNPLGNVYYHTEREYHCRGDEHAVVTLHGATLGDRVQVIWHGYEKPIRER